MLDTMAKNTFSMHELLCDAFLVSETIQVNGKHNQFFSPKQQHAIEERLAGYFCLKIKTSCIIEQGKEISLEKYLGETSSREG